MKNKTKKVVVPHGHNQVADLYLAKGYKPSWTSFEGVTLVKPKRKGGK